MSRTKFSLIMGFCVWLLAIFVNTDLLYLVLARAGIWPLSWPVLGGFIASFMCCVGVVYVITVLVDHEN